MRFIDIAIAALIGTSAMAGMTIWSPRPIDAASQRIQVQWELRDSLLNHIRTPGVVLQIERDPETVCSLVSLWSGSNVTFAAVVGEEVCGQAPLTTAVTASLTIQAPTEEVILQAWTREGA